jgi:hypothetical protein
MTCLPELDTYGTLKQFARNPNNIEALMAFRILQKRAKTKAVWSALNCFRANNLDAASDLYFGVSKAKKSKNQVTATGLAEMPAKERDATYLKLCASAGIKLDPKDLINARK